MSVISYGVCRLALVPVRGRSAHDSEQVTQLLFGDHYEVLSISADHQWAQIRIHTDQCEGWMDVQQHHEISEDFYNQINKTDYKVCMDVASPVLYKKLPLTILMGSVVPISSTELFKIEEQFAFNGESKSLGQRRDTDFIKQIARKYLGSPYQRGGKSPFGIDAPGLIQMIFKIAGYPLPRTLNQLMTVGRKVEHLESGQPGDVAFFSIRGGDPVHCGLLMGEEKVMHAFGQVRMDHITQEGIRVGESKAYSHYLHGLRRFVS